MRNDECGMMNDELKGGPLFSFIIHHSAFIIFLSLRGLRPAAQNFRDAPSLRDAAARRVRFDGVEDLADRADAGFVQVRHEAFEEASRARAVFGVDFEPSVYERADEIGRASCRERV